MRSLTLTGTPARAKSCSVAFCSEPLGKPKRTSALPKDLDPLGTALDDISPVPMGTTEGDHVSSAVSEAAALEAARTRRGERRAGARRDLRRMRVRSSQRFGYFFRGVTTRSRIGVGTA